MAADQLSTDGVNQYSQETVRAIPPALTHALTEHTGHYYILRCTQCHGNHIAWRIHIPSRRCPYCPPAAIGSGGQLGVLCLTYAGRSMERDRLLHVGPMWLRWNVLRTTDATATDVHLGRSRVTSTAMA